MDPELKAAIDHELIDWLSPHLKGSIDRLLTAGEPKYKILMAIRDGVRRTGQSPSRSMTFLAVQAYIKSKDKSKDPVQVDNG
jgi:hypothetical protein